GLEHLHFPQVQVVHPDPEGEAARGERGRDRAGGDPDRIHVVRCSDGPGRAREPAGVVEQRVRIPGERRVGATQGERAGRRRELQHDRRRAAGAVLRADGRRRRGGRREGTGDEAHTRAEERAGGARRRGEQREGNGDEAHTRAHERTTKILRTTRVPGNSTTR